MSNRQIIAHNQTGSVLSLANLAVIIPASGSLELTLYATGFEVMDDAELQALVLGDSVLLEIDGVSLDKAGSLNVMKPVVGGTLHHSELVGISATDHHSNVNDPSATEKAALAGTNGTPGGANKFVTNSDSRNTDARTPTAHAASHGSGQSDAVTVAQAQVTGLASALAAKANDNAVVHIARDESVDGVKTFRVSPVVPTPEKPDQAVNMEYVDKAIDIVSGPIAAGTANTAGLRAVLAADRQDKQVRLVESKGAMYRFDSTGTGADDDDLTIVPNDVTPPALGRWFKNQAATQDHESLTGLQGGTVGNHKHLTATELSYLPTSTQKEALSGTSGTPSNTNRYVTDEDSRNTDSRVPTAHASSHQPGGADAMAVDAVVSAGSLRTIGTGALQACAGNDTRLSDARTPLSHASSHKNGGSDSIKLDELASPTDVVTLNSSAVAHGLLPKLDNNAAHYLNGQGDWTTPPGSGALFGTQEQHEEDETTTSTTGTTLVSKVLMTTPSLPAGTYFIQWQSEMSVSAANRDHEVVARLDGVEFAIHTERLTIANYWGTKSGFKIISLSAGAHTVELLFRRPGGSSATIYARRARIEIWRVS